MAESAAVPPFLPSFRTFLEGPPSLSLPLSSKKGRSGFWTEGRERMEAAASLPLGLASFCTPRYFVKGPN